MEFMLFLFLCFRWDTFFHPTWQCGKVLGRVSELRFMKVEP